MQITMSFRKTYRDLGFDETDLSDISTVSVIIPLKSATKLFCSYLLISIPKHLQFFVSFYRL